MSLASSISDFLGGVKTGDGFLVKCVCHEDETPSLLIADMINKNGDTDIVVTCQAQCNWKDIKDKLRDMDLLPKFKPQRQATQTQTPESPESPPPSSQTEAPENFIWGKSIHDPNTIGKVLKTRAITIGFDSPAIRIGKYKDQSFLALAMTKPGDDKVLAVQRLPFDIATYTKTGKGKMYGYNKAGDNFCNGRGVFFYRKKSVDDFIVGEGVETTLTAMQITGHNGCACLSTSGMSNITLPEGIKRLYIVVDSDKGFGGQKVAIKLAQRYKDEIENVYFVTPCDSCFTDEPDKLDLNDLLMKDTTGESVKNRFDKAVKFDGDFKWTPPTKTDNINVSSGFSDETVKALEKLNETYAAVLMSGNFRVIQESFDKEAERHILFFLKTAAFTDFFRSKKAYIEKDDELKPVPLGRTWLDWEGRRTYDAVVFDPTEKSSKNVYNMFRGLIKPIQGDWSKMRKHTKDIICEGNEEYYQYLIGWLARAVQDPGGKRPGVTVVLRGGKGIGKSAWVDYYGKIFGESYFNISDPQHFTGRFNIYQSKTLILFLDEARWGGDKKSEGKMKALITQEYNMFEPKGIDSISMKNYMNIIIAGNGDWLVPATMDERRYFVLQVAEDFIMDEKYFDGFFHEYENGGPAAMMYDLLDYDYSAINLRKAPMTKSLGEQIEHSLPPVLSFWQSVLSRGFLLTNRYTGEPERTQYDATENMWPERAWKYELYNEFLEWCNKKKEKYVLSERPFWKKTYEIWPGGNPGKKQKRVDYQVFNFIVIPGLQNFQRAFAEMTKTSMEISMDDSYVDSVDSFNFGANMEDKF